MARSKEVKVVNLTTKEEKVYPSRAAAERDCGFSNKIISSKLRYNPEGFVIDDYQIVPIN